MPNKINVKLILYISFVTSLFSSIFLGILLYTQSGIPSASIDSIAKRLAEYSPTPDEKPKNALSLLLMGYGGTSHPGGGLADANILIHANIDTKKITIIHIPRDLWVLLPVRSDISTHYKFNHAFAIGNDDRAYPLKQTHFQGVDGGGALAQEATKVVTGIVPDYYMAIDFDRFVAAIDALNGISVDVPLSFTDSYYPIVGEENNLCGFSPEKMQEVHALYSGFELEKQFTCRYETLAFSQGPTQMDGLTALKFIRSRHSNNHGGDVARGVRQMEVIKAIKNKLLSLDALTKIDDFYAQFRRMVRSDIDKNDVVFIVNKLTEPEEYTIETLSIDERFVTGTTSSDGQSILVPNAGIDNYSQIKQYIHDSI